MQAKAAEFIKSYLGIDETCSVNYKPYIYGSTVDVLPFEKAVKWFVADLEATAHFFSSYGITDPEKHFSATCDMWKKHLYKLQP